jgi:hypothetical protein
MRDGHAEFATVDFGERCDTRADRLVRRIVGPAGFTVRAPLGSVRVESGRDADDGYRVACELEAI